MKQPSEHLLDAMHRLNRSFLNSPHVFNSVMKSSRLNFALIFSSKNYQLKLASVAEWPHPSIAIHDLELGANHSLADRVLLCRSNHQLVGNGSNHFPRSQKASPKEKVEESSTKDGRNLTVPCLDQFVQLLAFFQIFFDPNLLFRLVFVALRLLCRVQGCNLSNDSFLKVSESPYFIFGVNNFNFALRLSLGKH